MSESDDADDWENMIIADRMAVDQAFQEQVTASAFSNQAWSLVMTAVDFQIVNPEQPEEAYITVDSAQIDSVLPAMEEAEKALGGSPKKQSFTDKIANELRGYLGKNRGDAERRAEAEQLATAYANELHARLERVGKWEAVCERAAGAA